MNKDFYDKLPSFACEQLDYLIEKYGNEKWFNEAWEEYREHILSSSMFDMKMPGYIFKKYIDKENDK